MVLSSEIKPWDKGEGEPSRWWDRFNRFYRPQGAARTLTLAYRAYYEEVHGHPPTRPGYTADWKNKSILYEWAQRAEAWDEELYRETIAAEKAKAIEMTTRQIADSKAIQTLAMSELVKRGFSKESTVSIARALATAQNQERAARGIPEHLADIGGMSDEEIEREIARELVRAGISESGKEFKSDSHADGNDAGEVKGSEQEKPDDIDRHIGLPGVGSVSDEASGIRDRSTEGDAEELADKDPRTTS